MSSKKKQGPRVSPFAARSLSRSFVIQMAYARLLNADMAQDSWVLLQDEEESVECDMVYCRRLLDGVNEQWDALQEAITPFLDRSIRLVSPVELAIMLVAMYELKHCDDVPHRVILNEAIEQTKRFGSIDGHRYVNGVLDCFLNDKKQTS